jgi:hypothetical protein
MVSVGDVQRGVAQRTCDRCHLLRIRHSPEQQLLRCNLAVDAPSEQCGAGRHAVERLDDSVGVRPHGENGARLCPSGAKEGEPIGLGAAQGALMRAQVRGFPWHCGNGREHAPPGPHAAIRVLERVIDDVEAVAVIAHQDAEVQPGREEGRRAGVAVVDSLDVARERDAVVDAHDVAKVARVQLVALRLADHVIRRGEHATELHVLGVVPGAPERQNGGHGSASVADGASGLQSRTWRS